MILETNALSGVPDNQPKAVERYNSADAIALGAIVLGESRFGIAQSHKRNDYESWLRKLIGMTWVLDIDERTIGVYAQVRVELKKIGRPILSNDVEIAALSRQYSQPILSWDVHFDFVPGIQRLDWRLAAQITIGVLDFFLYIVDLFGNGSRFCSGEIVDVLPVIESKPLGA